MCIRDSNNVLRNFLINHKMTPEQKHEYATKICNYITLQKIPVSKDYYNQVLSSFVFVPSAPSTGYYYPYYSPPVYYDYSCYSYYNNPCQYQAHYQFLFTITQICLLYTSPSPRDLSTSRMPSSA
eukprot:TRINITY_DN6914_c0_g1_i6.p2 TRINITY_DN6914_c0_g1~~TRINITY_DN6914_c0_g1_i6.p2  ORF type:complete len:125 (+),score=10.11 TRINITY_DN6914_c0_g1_i6:151-525(+)